MDLFTSKVYVYTMKSRNLLSKILELFHHDVQQKKEQMTENTTTRLRICTKQNKKKSIKKINVEK